MLLEFDKSGFYPINRLPICNHPEHNPPMFLYIPPETIYVHICPGCHKNQILVNHFITC